MWFAALFFAFFTALYWFWWWRKHIPLPVEEIALKSLDKLVKGDHLFVSQESLASSIGCNKYEAFKIMTAMQQKGVLARNGWNFTITDRGYASLRNTKS